MLISKQNIKLSFLSPPIMFAVNNYLSENRFGEEIEDFDLIN